MIGLPEEQESALIFQAKQKDVQLLQKKNLEKLEKSLQPLEKDIYVNILKVYIKFKYVKNKEHSFSSKANSNQK